MNRLGRLGLGASILLLAVLAAACGTSTASKAPASTAANGDGQAQLQAYRQCLQQHGVNPDQFGRRPDGSGPPPSAPPSTDAKFAAAREACRDKLPQGFGNNPQGAQAMQAYISCMKDHGVTIPTDPGAFGNVNRNDPAFQNADKVCAPLRPSFGPGQGGQGGGGAPSSSAPGA